VLLRHDDHGVLAIGQASHAWLSGQLARVWGNDRFAAPDPYEEVCLAAEQHDVAFATWDLDPVRDPHTGLPYSFMEMPVEMHLQLWSAAPRCLLTQSRYAALLVSMHGSRLYKRRNLDHLTEAQVTAVRNYLDAQRRFQEEVSRGFDPVVVDLGSQLVWTWDFLSLVTCLDWTPRTARGVPTVDGSVDMEISALAERRLALDPWPFKDDLIRVRCEGRRLTGRYETEEALRAALSSASWETVEFELVATSA
jgi:hypothetical protein